ncbi:DUF2147 domain-containing protein [Pseudoprimorskyibacter insulae]|uniref:DUF2147 domain-containing protein n=1 Tax=Pseudoprimorskyibacter insulae TaxID=1695997 RepID=A0A2R8AQU6_9RHOB|nr:DUF2147 domain-containing protein [Pseudoprimorskyibacter insulae]SPF78340.1 hypothetical protein PRI8871_00936 [Pseudoprimorskyibacter insulae]
MKKTLTLALVALTLSAGIAVAQDPIEGVWQTQPDDGAFAHITLAPCGDKFCGLISKSFRDGKEFKSANHNKKLVYDMVPQGGNKYEGKVWRPSNNKVYLGKMSLSGNVLTMRGCVAGGLICSKQTWSRVK